jgi:phosphoribosylamine-glycine ligase
MEKPIAIVLGGTSPHILLVNKLHERGFYVILIDYLDNPPAKKVADEHVKESTLDKEIVLEVAKTRHAQLVISACIDQTNSICCYVAEILGLPHPYSYQTSLCVTDKGLMKRIMVDNGIPTSSFTTTVSIEAIDWEKIEFPAVVKPVDCNSSKGVRRVDSVEETKQRVAEAISLSRTKTAIIEGFNRGEEIQVDCLATESDVKVVMTRQKQKIASKGNDMVLQSYGSVFPAPISKELQVQAQEIATGIAKAFGLKNTPFFYQAIVTDYGIKVLEFAPRIGGGLSYYMLNEFANYDAVEYVIDSYLGNPLKFEPIQNNCFQSTILLYMVPGVFDHISGLDQLKEQGLVYEIFVMKAKGDSVDGDMRSSNRVAAFVIQGDSYDELRRKARMAIEKVEIFDNNNKPLLNRQIYSTL